METIPHFAGAFRFLSNFYPSPIMMGGLHFPTVEHAFQACKASDLPTARLISCQPTPGDAKRAGRRVLLRSTWEDEKVYWMSVCLDRKFEIPELASRLVQTGDAILIEGNAWRDRFWGVCDGSGENILGKLLMKKREELKGML